MDSRKVERGSITMLSLVAYGIGLWLAVATARIAHAGAGEWALWYGISSGVFLICGGVLTACWAILYAHDKAEGSP